MEREKVKSVFEMLASSQGFYGRLLRDLEELTEEEQQEFYSQFKDCKSSVDVVLTIEC